MTAREARGASALLLLSLLTTSLLVGCLKPGQVDQSVEAASGSSSDGPAQTSKKSTSGGVPESTVGVASRVEVDLAATDDATSGVPFVEKSEQSGGSGYDADTVLAVRYGDQGDYERAVIDLGTGDEPAGTMSRWTLVDSGGDGLLRVNLPSASATCVSGGAFGDGLLDNFHVVRAPEGGMFVDFFARKAFLYRVVGLEDPARLVVDFKPAGASLKAPLPAERGDTVLVEPRPGTRISDPLTVSGYSRNREAADTITLIGQHGRALVRKTVESNDWNHTWGYFEATIDLPPFSGAGTLKVGTKDSGDGSFDGVEIPVWADGPARSG